QRGGRGADRGGGRGAGILRRAGGQWGGQRDVGGAGPVRQPGVQELFRGRGADDAGGGGAVHGAGGGQPARRGEPGQLHVQRATGERRGVRADARGDDHGGDRGDG